MPFKDILITSKLRDRPKSMVKILMNRHTYIPQIKKKHKKNKMFIFCDLEIVEFGVFINSCLEWEHKGRSIIGKLYSSYASWSLWYTSHTSGDG